MRVSHFDRCNTRYETRQERISDAVRVSGDKYACCFRPTLTHVLKLDQIMAMRITVMAMMIIMLRWRCCVD